MAFVILDNNKFCKVARNEADKNDMNINPRTGSEVEISDLTELRVWEYQNLVKQIKKQNEAHY